MMRAQKAVHRLDLTGLMGDTKMSQINMLASPEIYTVLTYDAVFEVLRDGAALLAPPATRRAWAS